MIDPVCLERAIPGCERFRAVGPVEFNALVRAGIGAFGGYFEGTVRFADVVEHSELLIVANGAGRTGSITGGARLELREESGGTRVRYDGEAQAGGRPSLLGGAVLQPAARLMIGQFMRNMARIVE